MALKPNMYVRLNCNYELGIGKTIREIDEDNFIKTKFKDDFECSVPMYMILKASHNIIEILEERDYVNGCKVIKNTLKDGGNIVIVQGGNCFTNDDIKTVVTKEQFESMEYRLGDK